MSVGDVECIHVVGEEPGDLVDGLVVVDHPELVSEVVFVDEIIFRSLGHRLGHDLVEDVVVLVSEEDRFDVGVLDADVDHSVVFLVLARQLVLLDLAGSVVIRVGAEDEAVLRPAFHCLGIYIVALLGITLEPSLCLPLLEVAHRLVIYQRVVVLEDRVEINLGLGDVEQRFLAGHVLGFY